MSCTASADLLTKTRPQQASCAEFDGPQNQLTALLVNNDTSYNATSLTSNLTYYACPESQRNFTAYNHRFYMNGEKSNGRGNHWYSFDYGLAHFVSFSGETDYYKSVPSSCAFGVLANRNSAQLAGEALHRRHQGQHLAPERSRNFRHQLGSFRLYREQQLHGQRRV